MQPRDRLTAKEIQIATLVWQGLTNKDIARVLITSEQVVKNYLRTAFDKLGVWTRLELALYVAGHGGANWHVPLGNGLASSPEWTPAVSQPPQVVGSKNVNANDNNNNDSSSASAALS
jgi:DNA-binding CsgD family transcriptional regulator